MTMPTPRPEQSTQVRNPSQDLQTNERKEVYIAALERRLVMLELRDIKLRSVCEAATGIPYDSFDPSEMSFDDICEIVAKDMARGLGINIKDARDIVNNNKATANPD